MKTNKKNLSNGAYLHTSCWRHRERARQHQAARLRVRESQRNFVRLLSVECWIAEQVASQQAHTNDVHRRVGGGRSRQWQIDTGHIQLALAGTVVGGASASRSASNNAVHTIAANERTTTTERHNANALFDQREVVFKPLFFF